MLPPPTTIATATSRLWTAETSAAIACTRSGSVPYSRSPINASPESFSSTRLYTVGGALVAIGSATYREPREAAHDDVLAGLGRERLAQLLDRLATVLVLVDVLLAEQNHIVQPLVDLAGDRARTGLV